MKDRLTDFVWGLTFAKRVNRLARLRRLARRAPPHAGLIIMSIIKVFLMSKVPV